ncbi:carotenoid 1,2-hydratase [Stappia stellulata]|uniref:carotenoid 1,2-hydratase n=1 Tax=Stappia stellulata TaxID=71235 RepID=UPI001CD3CC50|nr:carotenoid 1,2-hydratase [Stappia stellulata]MCA1244006.1 carotenoid 1,2-hydratase [Stappia stellulata]
MSDCGRHAVTVIAFVGSVFSPYYAWSGRQDPENHVAINVALYSAGRPRWAMTERGRAALNRSGASFRVGPSSLRWDDAGGLTLDFDEIALPFPGAGWLPGRIRGTIRLVPRGVTGTVFDIDDRGAHRWWPIAPAAGIEVDLARGGPSWRGHGYLDSNWGVEPLETGFRRWDWARGRLADGRTAILYDASCRSGTRRKLALCIGSDGTIEQRRLPKAWTLGRGTWGVERFMHADAQGDARVLRALEDGPFYTRAIVESRIWGEPVTAMHETFSGDRFARPLVKAMLPFRMPRRSGRV